MRRAASGCRTVHNPADIRGRQAPGKLRFAKATYKEMVAAYRQSVLTAFSEVEDNLAAQTLLANQYPRKRRPGRRAKTARNCIINTATASLLSRSSNR